MAHKPDHVFGRDEEWEALTSFATGSQPEVALGVVSGRRRQGKTFLLKSLTEALGGFYFEATEGTDIELLRLFGMALARHTVPPWATRSRTGGTPSSSSSHFRGIARCRWSSTSSRTS